MENLVRYEVKILGRTIPLKIKSSQKEETDQIVKDLNDKLADFQLKYEKVDKIDSLIMVLLSYAFEKGPSNNEMLTKNLLEKMKALGNKIEE